jgi:hypothetical protein
MNYKPPLTIEEHAAYLSMPKTQAGVVVSLFYVPKEELSELQAAWRVWLANHPRHLWPNWVTAWAATRKADHAHDDGP